MRADGKRTKAVERIDRNNNGVLEDATEKTTIDWVYDEVGRLTEEHYSSYDNALSYTDKYFFDLASNRLKYVHDSTVNANDKTVTSKYDANDRLFWEKVDLLSDNSVQTTTFYQYNDGRSTTTGDALDGTAQTHKATYSGDFNNEPTSGATSVVINGYNVQGRLEQVQVVDGGTATTYTYKYNSDGIRVTETKQVGAGSPTTTIFHVDPNNQTGFAQIIEEGTDTSGDGRLQQAEIGKSYTIGSDVIAQNIAANAQYLLYDGG